MKKRYRAYFTGERILLQTKSETTAIKISPRTDGKVDYYIQTKLNDKWRSNKFTVKNLREVADHLTSLISLSLWFTELNGEITCSRPWNESSENWLIKHSS